MCNCERKKYMLDICEINFLSISILNKCFDTDVVVIPHSELEFSSSRVESS